MARQIGTIPLSFNFRKGVQLPLLDTEVVDSIADRDSIPSIERHAGMQVWVKNDQVRYELLNDLTTWRAIGGAVSPDRTRTTYALGSGTSINLALTSPDGGTFAEYRIIDVTTTGGGTRTITAITGATNNKIYQFRFSGIVTTIEHGTNFKTSGQTDVVLQDNGYDFIEFQAVGSAMVQYNGDTFDAESLGGGGGGGDATTLQGQNGAYYLNRANHSGTQAIATITGLQTILDGKVDDSQIAPAVDDDPATIPNNQAVYNELVTLNQEILDSYNLVFRTPLTQGGATFSAGVITIDTANADKDILVVNFPQTYNTVTNIVGGVQGRRYWILPQIGNQYWVIASGGGLLDSYGGSTGFGSLFSAAEFAIFQKEATGFRYIHQYRKRASLLNEFVPLIIFIGESNSGGVAPNAAASAPELAPRNVVQILNNTTLQFENLDVGTNNIIDHAGLDLTTHGWEIGLANTVEAGNWIYPYVYLVKAGQGGSTISQWGNTGTYWTKFINRYTAAYNAITSRGQIPVPYVWYTHGINDAIAGTNTATWKAAVVDFIKRIREVVGFVPILMTRLMPAYNSFNTVIDEIASEDNFVYAVPTTGLTLLGDGNHWDYASMKTIATDMKTICVSQIGLGHNYILTQNKKLALRTTTSTTPPATLGPATAITWGNLSGVTESSGQLTYASGTTAGATGDTIDATQDFELILSYANATNTEAIVIGLAESQLTNYDWSSNPPYIAGIYHFASTIYEYVNMTYTTTGTSASSFPIKLRMKKSGNNIICAASTDGGTTYVDFHTISGVLAGKTALTVKAIFAVPASGKTVTVQKRIPV